MKRVSKFSKDCLDAIIMTCNFSGHSLIADIGGGTGEFLLRVLKDELSANGILFELPQCIDRAKKVLFYYSYLPQDCPS